MENLDRILLSKALDNYENANAIYVFIRELKDHVIVKKIDTVTNEESIEALEKGFIRYNLYTLREFLNTSNYIGMSGYYDGMDILEVLVNQDMVVVYKDEYNDLIYDTVDNSFFIAPSVYPIETFNPYEEQDHMVRFKKGYGKNNFEEEYL